MPSEFALLCIRTIRRERLGNNGQLTISWNGCYLDILLVLFRPNCKYCIGVLSRPNIGVLPGLESLEPLTVRRPHCSTGPQPVTITPPLERSLQTSHLNLSPCMASTYNCNHNLHHLCLEPLSKKPSSIHFQGSLLFVEIFSTFNFCQSSFQNQEISLQKILAKSLKKHLNGIEFLSLLHIWVHQP